MTKESLTQEQLQEFLNYNPKSGIFTWIKQITNIRIGYIAGSANSAGYIQLSLKRNKYYAHRLAFLYMTGSFPEHECDHINHVKSDNRWKNLREVTRQGNNKNMSMRKCNTSGTTGVCWVKDKSKWRASITLDGEQKYLGYFNDIKLAIASRLLAEDKYGFHKNHGK